MSYETHADLVTKNWELEKENWELKDENKRLLKALTKIIVEDCSLEECWDTAITVKAKIRQEREK